MATSAKLEASYQADRGIPSFGIKLPHTAPAFVPVILPLGSYPTHRHLCAGIETAVENATTFGPTVSGISGDFFCYVDGDGKFVLKSDTMQMGLSFVDPEADGADDLRPFMGLTATTYSAASTQISDVVPASTFLLARVPYMETWIPKFDRTANFGDDGRVSAILIGRTVVYRCTLTWTNAEHDQWLEYCRWMYQGRKVALWAAYDDAASPWTDNYELRPLPTSTGYKLLFLDSNAQPDVDNPYPLPNYIGHTTQIEGVLYAL